MGLPNAALPVPLERPISTPYLLVIRADEQFALLLERSPFAIGRKQEKELCIPDQRISRDHAVITREGDSFFLEDQGSKLGTYVNGMRISSRQKLARNDRIDFGAADVGHIVFFPKRLVPPVTRPSLKATLGNCCRRSPR